MNRFISLACTAAALLISTSVFAGDRSTNGAQSFDWSGCYAGAEGGGAWGTTKHVATIGVNAGLTQFSTDANGGLAGGTIGCNYQTNNWVWGIENDFSWTDIGGSKHNSPPFATGVVGRTSANWLDTLRGRAGYAVGRSLWYVTGGVAFSKVEGSAELLPVIPRASITHDRTGWVVGGGVEWALADPHWSIKAEYLYVDFGKSDYNFGAISGGALANSSVHLNENIARVGINYKFGGSSN
jgi:outer membrane immunogenic protein